MSAVHLAKRASRQRQFSRSWLFLCPMAWMLAHGSAWADAAPAAPAWLPDNSLGTGLPMFADPGGLRAALWTKGIKFQLNSIEEVLGDVSGGARRGAIEEGRLELVVDVDLAKALGWTGAALHANAYEIHGSGLSRNYVDNLETVSNIEALPSTRLYEAWFEQKFANGNVAVRVGQLAADTEFFTSDSAGLFINSTFGWPAIDALDLPSGGPAYPLATPGARLSVQSNDQKVSFLLGIYDGNPAGPGPGDPQILDPYGLNFRVTDPPFVIGEGQFKYGGDKASDPLPGVVKIGAWTNLGQFADPRFGTDGLLLASPASNGMPVEYRGDQGVYGLIDQKIMRIGDDAGKGVNVFLRVAGSPSDRNLVDLYADAGLNFTGVWSARPDDAFGVAAAFSHISNAYRAAEEDVAFYSGLPTAAPSYEAVLEATYSAQIIPGWTVQPDLQYVIHPDEGAIDLSDPMGLRPLPNAVVVGVRSTVKF